MCWPTSSSPRSLAPKRQDFQPNTNRQLIDISYMQFLVGSRTLFFNLPFKRYNGFNDDNRLVSLWQLLSGINFKLEIRQALVSIPPKYQDVALMVYFVSLNLPLKQLKHFNRCRVHLQVLFWSYICSADGAFILGY